jgi:23S rRNA (guanosine2251-2'-O)-methyltransferase
VSRADTRGPRRGGDDLGGEIVPGRRAVRELLLSGRRVVRHVLLAREPDRSDVVDEIVELAARADVPVRIVDGARIAREAQIETHQGVVALAAPVASTPLADLCAELDAFLVAFDGITDPRNLGAILRTAEVTGATGALLPRHRSAPLSPAAVKAAAGAVEHLRVSSVAGIAGALEETARSDVWSVGIDADSTTSVADLEVADAPIVLVFGAEGSGLSRLVRERCDVLASIPMYGKIESLNVAAAAAIACAEVARLRHR